MVAVKELSTITCKSRQRDGIESRTEKNPQLPSKKIHEYTPYPDDPKGFVGDLGDFMNVVTVGDVCRLTSTR